MSLREQAREAIRTQILVGNIAPGEVQGVQTIASVLGVSITPVREAIMDLANAGMVEIIRNRGFRVPVLTEHDLDEIFTIRSMLEPPSMARLAEGPALPDPDAFARIADDCVEAARTGDLQGFLELDRELHLGLLALLDNRRLNSIVAQLRDQTRMQGLRALAERGELVDTAREHHELLTAIEARRGADAEAVMRRHLQHTRGVWAGRPEA